MKRQNTQSFEDIPHFGMETLLDATGSQPSIEGSPAKRLKKYFSDPESPCTKKKVDAELEQEALSTGPSTAEFDQTLIDCAGSETGSKAATEPESNISEARGSNQSASSGGVTTLINSIIEDEIMGVGKPEILTAEHNENADPRR
jgi:hypothetical protein